MKGYWCKPLSFQRSTQPLYSLCMSAISKQGNWSSVLGTSAILACIRFTLAKVVYYGKREKIWSGSLSGDLRVQSKDEKCTAIIWWKTRHMMIWMPHYTETNIYLLADWIFWLQCLNLPMMTKLNSFEYFWQTLNNFDVNRQI